MSLPVYYRGLSEHRFPRVSGDEPFRDAMAKGEITFSPRERG